jgi:hypothetical protein
MGQAPFEPPSVKGWPVNAQWLNLRWLQARRRGLQQLLTDEEVWASAALPAELSAELTPIPPLGLRLPAAASRGAAAAAVAEPAAGACAGGGLADAQPQPLQGSRPVGEWPGQR